MVMMLLPIPGLEPGLVMAPALLVLARTAQLWS